MVIIYSDRFPLYGTSGRNRGKCSVDCIQVIGESKVLVGCNDGLVRAINILPNKVLQNVASHESPVEAVAIQKSSNFIASSDGNFVKMCSYVEEESEDSDSDDDSDGETKEKKEVPTDAFFSDL